MTEYDYSPEAYERFIQTQNRVTNWVHHTERHRQGFESAAPGAPGIPPVPRQLSPSIEESLTHKASPSYPMALMYHRVSPFSENSCVQMPPPPQTRRLRPFPPSKYVSPVPLHMAVHTSPVGRVKDNRFYSSSSRHHHVRAVSHSHPYHPPPLMTPIYTSPAASPFIPPPPIIHMYSQGHPSSAGTRPVNSLREIYRKSSSLRKARPQTPPATLLSNSSSTPTSTGQTSSPNSPSSAPFPPSPAPALGLLNSGHSGSRFHAFSIPWTEDPNQKPGNMSSTTLPRLDSTSINHNPQEQSFHSCQRLDHQPQSYHHNLCHSQDRRSVFPSDSHSHFQPCPALRTQPYAGPSDLLYDNYESKPSPVTVITPHNNTISISVPPRFPPDDRESSINSISSHSHPYMKQITPYVLHAPQPMRHPDMLNPQLRA